MQEINVARLNEKKKTFKSLSDDMTSIIGNLSSINNRLDWQIKNKYNINGILKDLTKNNGEIHSKFKSLISMLDVTINGYNEAEKQIESKLKQISQVNKPAKKSWFDKVCDFIEGNLTGLLKILRNLFIFGPAFIVVSGIEEITSYLSKTEVKMKVDNSKAKMILNNGTQDIKGTLKKSKEYNEQVKMMQSRLRELGYTIEVDGYFGDETYKIVNEFKNKYGLGNTGEVEGVVGSQTWKYLFSALDGKLGHNSDQYKEEVKAAQVRLKELGYAVEVNGYFDDKTLEAVNEFKDKNKLGNTGQFKGIIGSQTWGLLFNSPIKIKNVNKVGPEQSQTTNIKDTNSTINFKTLNDQIDKYVNFIYTDASGKKSDKLQIYYEWAGKMSIEQLNKKMIELGLKADDQKLQDKVTSLGKSEKVMLGIDCSGFVLSVVDKATNGKATQYYRDNIKGLKDVKDILTHGVLASDLTSLNYSQKITNLSDVMPGDYIRFAKGTHIGVVYKVEGDTIYYAHSSGSKGPHLATIKVSEVGKTGLDLKKNATFNDWDNGYSKFIQGKFDYICRPNFTIEKNVKIEKSKEINNIAKQDMPKKQMETASIKEQDAIKRFLRLTINHEGAGKFSNVSNPGDNMALSYGFYQWNIGQGTFQRLLCSYDEKYPKKLEDILGTDMASKLRKNVLYRTDGNGNLLKNKEGKFIKRDNDSGLAWAIKNISNGKYGVKKEWADVLIKLGKDETMQKVQVNDAIQNYIKPAISQLSEFNLELTDRNLFIMNDMLVQGGGFYYEKLKKIDGKDIKIDKSYYLSKINDSMTPKEKLVAIIAARASTCNPEWERNFAVRKIPYVMGYGYTRHGQDKNLNSRFSLNPQEILDKKLGEKNGYKEWKTGLDKEYGFNDKALSNKELSELLTVDNVWNIINEL